MIGYSNSKKLLPVTCLLLLLIATLPVFSQQKLITGRVTDSTDGSALANVSVSIRNGQPGTQTDYKGNFKLLHPSSTAFITVSSAEFQAKNRDQRKLLSKVALF